MIKHQKVAIIVGVIVAVVSFLPVFMIWQSCSGYSEFVNLSLYHKAFMYPTIGVSVAAVIVFYSFFKRGKKNK